MPKSFLIKKYGKKCLLRMKIPTKSADGFIKDFKASLSADVSNVSNISERLQTEGMFLKM